MALAPGGRLHDRIRRLGAAAARLADGWCWRRRRRLHDCIRRLRAATARVAGTGAAIAPAAASTDRFLPGGTRLYAAAHVAGHEPAGSANHAQHSGIYLVPVLDVFLPCLADRKSLFQHEPAHRVVACLVCRMQLRLFVFVIAGVSLFPVGLDADDVPFLLPNKNVGGKPFRVGRHGLILKVRL